MAKKATKVGPSYNRPLDCCLRIRRTAHSLSPTASAKLAHTMRKIESVADIATGCGAFAAPSIRVSTDAAGGRFFQTHSDVRVPEAT